MYLEKLAATTEALDTPHRRRYEALTAALAAGCCRPVPATATRSCTSTSWLPNLCHVGGDWLPLALAALRDAKALTATLRGRALWTALTGVEDTLRSRSHPRYRRRMVLRSCRGATSSVLKFLHETVVGRQDAEHAAGGSLLSRV